MKVVCPDGKKRTFTQRGALDNEGFVRVNGKTVTGFELNGKFYQWSYMKNAGLLPAWWTNEAF